MKFEIRRLSSLFLIQSVLLVNIVVGQFAKGVVRNNVFTHYVHSLNGESNDLNGTSANSPNIGYIRNNLNTTKTTPLPYNTLSAIKPTTSAHKSYPIKKPQTSPWNPSSHPVIAYTLPPNMKIKLANAMHHGNQGLRTRSTKMNTATTPESMELNNIIIKNFLQHLSTTKSNIESTIPNPNQFHSTPSSEGSNAEVPVIVNSNQFFPIDHQYNSHRVTSELDDESPAIIISSSKKNINSTIQNLQSAGKYPITMATQSLYSATKYTLTTPMPIHNFPPSISSRPPVTHTNHHNLKVPIKKTSTLLLHSPTRRRPISSNAMSKLNKGQSVIHSTTQPFSPQPLANVASTTVSQQHLNSHHQPLHSMPTQSAGSVTSHQLSRPVYITPNKENSLNVFNAVPPHAFSKQSYPITDQRNSLINQQSSQMFNSLPQLLKFTEQQKLNNYNQSLPPMTHLPQESNRPNNSLKQLQLQFLLDCSLLDPQTKTRIPLGTNPVGDDFFFTPMPFTQHNHPQSPVNMIQNPQFPLNQQNPLNSQNFLSPVSLFSTTLSPLTTIQLIDQNVPTQTTQQPIHVSIQPSQNAHRRRRKKVKNVYVDLPIVSEVGNMLDKVYNFMEESLVTKVVKKTEKHPSRRIHVTLQGSQSSQPSQGSHASHGSHGSHGSHKISSINNPAYPSGSDESDEDYSQRYTTPYYRTTRSRQTKPKRRRPGSDTYYTNRLPSNNWMPVYHRQKRTTVVPKNDRNKNYLTTKIHVTSEYNGPNPTDSLDYDDINRRKVGRPESSEEDDYYYDSLTLDGLNFDTGTYEDDDDEDDDDDVDESNSVQENINKKVKLKKPKRKYSKQAESLSSESDSYEDDADDDYYSPSMGMFGNFFGNVFSSVNKYVPSFRYPSFSGYFGGGGGSKELDYNSIEREERSTTPMIETRHPKNPKYIFSDYSDYNIIDNPDVGGSWYNPFNFGSNELTTPSTDLTTDASSDYWNWFGNSNENVESTPAANNSGWFYGLFGNNDETVEPTATSTTKRPFLTVDNPMYKPHNWLGILANHLVSNKPSTNNTPVVPQKATYDNYQLWRLMPESEDQVKFLEEYRKTPEGAKLQWWKGPTLRGPTDIAVPPSVIAEVKMSLDYEDISHEVVMWDLEKAIKFENPPMTRREKLEMEITQEHPLSWYRYHRYDDIVKFLEYLQRKYSNSVELIHIGRSFEGRPLIVAKISAKQSDPEHWKGKITDKKKKKTKRSIFIESGTHAREWITPAVTTWILDKLVQGLNNTDSLGETIRSVDWYIMPVINPDGYEYSHQYDRLWRKTRSKHKEEESIFSNALNWLRKDQKAKEETCYGTDLNRNWNHNWSEKGSSKSACSEFYAGPKPFSEPESKALSKFLEEHKKHMKIYLNLHSYGQIISYSSHANASYNSIKSDDLLDMAQVALEALRGIGSSTRYTVDNTNEMMYARSGSSDLYAMYDIGIKYSYTMELRDTGTHGFLLPPSNIESTAKETFEIIKGMVDYI